MASKTISTHNRPFDVQTLLDLAGMARNPKEFKKAEVVYSQGDAANSIIFLQKGGVKLTVVNEAGKEAVTAILGPDDFFGESCLTGQSVRMGSATAITPVTVHVIEKGEMLRVLHEQNTFSDQFIISMLTRKIRTEEDLIDQLFNSTEKRLARTLLLLAGYGKEAQPSGLLPHVTQEILAEMVGTTRPRINFFMNKFRKSGLIKYKGGIEINNSLLSVVLHD
jgi:CRP/FNR family transcriptional regulator, cyclic AMP receptor protein